MMKQRFASEPPEPIPAEVRSPRAKLVYFYVSTAGSATTDELSDTLSLKKMTVLSVLHSLSSQGLVQKEDGEYVTAD